MLRAGTNSGGSRIEMRLNLSPFGASTAAQVFLTSVACEMSASISTCNVRLPVVGKSCELWKSASSRSQPPRWSG
jgi:hypothetical protein